MLAKFERCKNRDNHNGIQDNLENSFSSNAAAAASATTPQLSCVFIHISKEIKKYEY
jgi:hypothetical protein